MIQSSVNKTKDGTRHLLLAAMVAGGFAGLGSGPAAAAMPDGLVAAVQKAGWTEIGLAETIKGK